MATRRDGCDDPCPVAAVVAALLESIPSGVLIFNSQGDLQASNARFEELLRIDSTRLQHLRSFEALVLELSDRFVQPDAVAARWRERFNSVNGGCDELHLLRPQRKVLSRVSRPMLSAGGQRIGFLEIYDDVTGERLRQSRLFHTERLATLGQMVSGIAHELNNPLASILGYAQLLVGRGIRASDGEHVLKEAQRASRIARNLLLFARETKLTHLPLSLNEVVERTVELRSAGTRRQNIRLQADLDSNLPSVYGDFAQLQQILLNLILNAEQAIQQTRKESTERAGCRGHIIVRTSHTLRDGVSLEVCDDGPGIAAEVLPRIFDPFFTTKPPETGTGLGLSIVYSIVQDHGGHVDRLAARSFGSTCRSKGRCLT